MSDANFLSQAQAIAPTLVELRRRIHMNPELGLAEHATSELCRQNLEKLGIEIRTGINKTGVIGLLRGGTPGRTIAIRADMDALPIQEQTGAEYASRNAGKMHACGHDSHVAMLIGAAMMLSPMKSKLTGNIKLIFQPNEEVPPGGAIGMIEQGALDDPKVNAIIALHVEPLLEVGKIGVLAGPFMAAVDSLTIKINGVGGHAARPHLGVDAIVVAAQVINSLQSIVSRQVDPFEKTVISIGQINGGASYNIIADKVVLAGTVRTLTPQLRDAMERMIRRTVECVVQSFGATCKIDYDRGNPMVINDAAISAKVAAAASKQVGQANVVPAAQSLGGEDFAYFLQTVPGCMFRLGTRNEAKGIIYPWHHCKFDIDESAMPIGAATLAAAAVDLLGGW